MGPDAHGTLLHDKLSREIAVVVAHEMDPARPCLCYVKIEPLDVSGQGEDVGRSIAPCLVGAHRHVAETVGARRLLHDLDSIGKQSQTVCRLHNPDVVVNGPDIYIFFGLLVEFQSLVVIEITQVEHTNVTGIGKATVEYARVVGLVGQLVAHPVEHINPLTLQQSGGSLPNWRARFGKQVGPVLSHTDFIPFHSVRSRSAVGSYQADAVEARGAADVQRCMPRGRFLVRLGRNDVVRGVGQ